jgi:hypothetical protein
MLGKLLIEFGWRLALTARGTYRARAVDHFLPGRLKKSGYMPENVSFRSVYDGQLQLCMYLLDYSVA